MFNYAFAALHFVVGTFVRGTVVLRTATAMLGSAFEDLWQVNTRKYKVSNDIYL